MLQLARHERNQKFWLTGRCYDITVELLMEFVMDYGFKAHDYSYKENLGKGRNENHLLIVIIFGMKMVYVNGYPIYVVNE